MNMTTKEKHCEMCGYREAVGTWWKDTGVPLIGAIGFILIGVILRMSFEDPPPKIEILLMEHSLILKREFWDLKDGKHEYGFQTYTYVDDVLHYATGVEMNVQ